MGHTLSKLSMTRWLAVTAFLLAAAACGDQAEMDEDPALGPPRKSMVTDAPDNIVWNPYNRCEPPQKTKIRRAMALVQNRLYNGDAFMSCLRDAVMNLDKGRSPEYILKRLRENKLTKIACADSRVWKCGGKKGWNACGSIGVSFERLTFDDGFLARSTDARVAGVLLHEVAHNKGFRHPGSKRHDYAYTVLEVVEHCLEDFTTKANRSTMPNETELSRVGGPGGQPYRIDTSAGAFIDGLAVGIGQHSGKVWVRRLRAHQVRVNGGTPRWRSWIGGGSAPSTYLSGRCRPSELLTGIYGTGTNAVESIGYECTGVQRLRARLQNNARRVRLGGGTAAASFHRTCPVGMAVKRIVGRSSAIIDEIRLICQDVRLSLQQERPVRTTTAQAGWWRGRHTSRQCMGYGAMTGLFAQVGSEVLGLGGVCQPTRRSTGRVLLRSSGEHLLPVAGSTRMGAHYLAKCPANMALYGVRVRSAAKINQVRALCVRTSKWNVNSTLTSSDYHVTGQLGGNGGSSRDLTCPRGEFVVGLDVLVDRHYAAATVHGLRAICRRL